MTKRLYRSRQHKVFAGVCSGVGEYFDVDPVFVRILTVILCFAHGIGLIAYLVAWIAMPPRGGGKGAISPIVIPRLFTTSLIESVRSRSFSKSLERPF